MKQGMTPTAIAQGEKIEATNTTPTATAAMNGHRLASGTADFPTLQRSAARRACISSMPSSGDSARISTAAGALAPSHLGHVADGYRVALDDKFRTGIRAAAQHEHLDAVLEIDDVLAPALIGGGVRYAMSPPWSMHLTLAIDLVHERIAWFSDEGVRPLREPVVVRSSGLS